MQQKLNIDEIVGDFVNKIKELSNTNEIDFGYMLNCIVPTHLANYIDIDGVKPNKVASHMSFEHVLADEMFVKRNPSFILKISKFILESDRITSSSERSYIETDMDNDFNEINVDVNVEHYVIDDHYRITMVYRNAHFPTVKLYEYNNRIAVINYNSKTNMYHISKDRDMKKLLAFCDLIN